jgi:D-amino-acid dehydrogenase
MGRADILIVGGGLIGVCSAYELARRGARVLLLEKGEIGDGASYGNAGAATPGHLPINKPGRVRQALRSLFDPRSPLYVPPRWDPALLRWFESFRQSCTEAHLTRSMEVLGPLGLTSRRLLGEWIETEAIDCDFRPAGYAEVYLTGKGLEGAEREAGMVARYGYRPERLDGAALRDREPALRDEVLGGVYFPEAATLNPRRFAQGLAAAAGRRGARVEGGAEVTGIRTGGGRVLGVRLRSGELWEADRVVLAAGSYSGPLLRKLGLALPLQPAKGYHIDRDPSEGGSTPLDLPCLLGERGIFCTPMGAFVRFAGTLEFSGMNHELRRNRLDQLARSASLYLRNLGPAPNLSEWCGLRPCLPDGLPAVGPVPGVEGLFLATGHAMMGLTLGPGTGQRVAEMVLGGTLPLPDDPLRVDRFPGVRSQRAS